MPVAINKQHVTVGIVVVLLVFGLTWRASSFRFALILWLCLVAGGLLVLHLLRRNRKAPRAGAAPVERNAIFLLFLPKNIQEGIAELKRREKT